MVVIDSAQNCSIFSRATKKLLQSFTFPSNVVTITALQSHLVVLAQSESKQSNKSPRAGSGQKTQADVFTLV